MLKDPKTLMNLENRMAKKPEANEVANSDQILEAISKLTKTELNRLAKIARDLQFKN